MQTHVIVSIKKGKIASKYNYGDLARIFNDPLAISLGFLPLEEMCTNKRISKDFQKMCVQALVQVRCFNNQKYLRGLPGDSAFNVLLTNCPNITDMVVESISSTTLFSVLCRWGNLKKLEISSCTFPPKWQYLIIPQIAKSLPSLTVLLLQDIFTIPCLDVTPLQTLDLLEDLYLYEIICSQDELKVIGFGSLINNSKFANFGFNGRFVIEFVSALKKCGASALEDVSTLYLSCEPNREVLTSEQCRLLVAKMPNLKTLDLYGMLSSQALSVINELENIENLGLDFSCMTPSTMKQLTTSGNFVNLRKLRCVGTLPFDPKWLILMEVYPHRKVAYWSDDF